VRNNLKRNLATELSKTADIQLKSDMTLALRTSRKLEHIE